MAAHIRPKRFCYGGHFGSYGSGQGSVPSNLIPHMPTTTATTTTTTTTTTTPTTTTTTATTATVI